MSICVFMCVCDTHKYAIYVVIPVLLTYAEYRTPLAGHWLWGLSGYQTLGTLKLLI